MAVLPLPDALREQDRDRALRPGQAEELCHPLRVDVPAPRPVDRQHQRADAASSELSAYRGDTPVDMMDKPLCSLPTSPQAQQQEQEDRFKGILAA